MKYFPIADCPAPRHELSTIGISMAFWGRPQPFMIRRISNIRRKLAMTFGWSVVSAPDYHIKYPDLVVFSSPGNAFPQSAVDLCVRRSIPYVLLIQSVSESEWISDKELDTRRSAYQGADAVFFVSEANLESTACQLAYRGSQFRVISNPYNVDRTHLFQPPKPGGCRRIAFVGRLEPEHKGLDLLFRALSRPAWQRRDFRLNIYGTGRSAKQVEEMAAFLGIAHRITFHGHVSSIASIWKENELLVLPSRHEGLPLAVIEAMMCGRPCLVTDVSGNPEHIEDGRTGFIAAGPTVNAVAVALERAWDAQHQWQAMGRAAYTSIRNAIPEDPVKVFTDEILKLAGSDANRLKATNV